MSAALENYPAEQGSVAWIETRKGKLTASRVADAFGKLKSGEYASARRDYMLELLAERLTGIAAPHYVSREMLEGIENEEFAVAAYETDRDVFAEPIGFIDHPTIAMAGASPDRAVGNVGLLEIKAPKTTTFLQARLCKELGVVAFAPARADPDDGYLAQCMWQLACCPNREWNDLAYYDPRMPFGKQLFVRRIHRDEKIIAAMEAEALLFLDELAALEEKFK